MRSPRIMVLGDSLASGMHDDYTWRWQLAQHFRRTGTPAEFVGPYTGTFSMYDDPVLLALVEGKPIPTGPDVQNPMTGSYREGRFEGGHCARPGWTAHAAKASVREHVAAERPDFLLVQLGFNDLATVGPPEQALRDLTAVVSEARSAASALVVLAASIAGTTTWGNAWFRDTIRDYNAKLPSVLAALSTDVSPVALVDVHSDFDPDADTYDGIHPNPSGELAMARSFADALLRFGVGRVPLRLPPTRPPELPLAEPTIAATRARDASIRLTWNRVRGASAYRVALRDVTLGEPRRVGPIPVLGDRWLAQGLTAGHLYEFDVTSARGERLGPRSKLLRLSAGL
ncbi:GDSL-type esterase/lipase family protein [Catenulispora rubra]|uniref:GDSL-type esterase/lipase family protein n=1 Tax=Catenulispora rubra TaxID=280293 RepID=UPI00189271CB|nr:GDSL-type esterase/lipase family protein [Catenulispora rubra]